MRYGSQVKKKWKNNKKKNQEKSNIMGDGSLLFNCVNMFDEFSI